MTFLWAAGSSREDDRVASSRLTKQYHCGYSTTAAAAGCFLRRTRVKVKKQLLSLYMLLCVISCTDTRFSSCPTHTIEHVQ